MALLAPAAMSIKGGTLCVQQESLTLGYKSPDTIQNMGATFAHLRLELKNLYVIGVFSIYYYCLLFNYHCMHDNTSFTCVVFINV